MKDWFAKNRGLVAILGGLGLSWVIAMMLFRDSIPANVKAFLDMIGLSEGANYNTLFGGGAFNNYHDHPRQLVHAGSYASDAAGRYQILSTTWDTVIQPALNLPDFSPASQDQAAIYLLKYRGAYPLIIAGDIASALPLAGKEWASIPGSPYGQPTHTIAQAEAWYTQNGGTLA